MSNTSFLFTLSLIFKNCTYDLPLIYFFKLFFYFENLICLPSFSHNTRIVLTILEIVFFVQIWTSECKQCLDLIPSSIFAGLEMLLINCIGIPYSLLPVLVKLKAEHLGAEEMAGVLEHHPGTENRSQSSPCSATNFLLYDHLG